MGVGKIIYLFKYIIARFFPRNKEIWIFGSWFGKVNNDSPLVVAKTLLNNKDKYIKLINELNHDVKDLEIIWIGENKENIPDGIRFIKIGSKECHHYCLKANVAVFNQGHEDFCEWNLISGAYSVNLWHGIIWKKVGEYTVESNRNIIKRFTHFVAIKLLANNLYVASSEWYRNVICKAFNAKPNHVMLCGQPRNELLLDSTERENSNVRIREQLGVPNDKVIIAYMPTFRDTTSRVFSFSNNIDSRIKNLLENNNAVIIEKSHFAETAVIQETDQRFLIVNNNLYSQDLLCSADILITDYSGCLFDFLLLDRPIIQYMYDFDYYANSDRGFSFGIEEINACEVAYDYNSLLEKLVLCLKNPNVLSEKRKKARQKFLKYESVHDSDLIIRRIINDRY